VGYPVLTDGLLEAKYGVTAPDFEIPDPVTDKEVSGEQFGFDPDAADNSAAFNAAAAYLRGNPGTKLTLEKGVYRMGGAAVSFDGVKNCVVDGGGSTFVFDFARYFTVDGCEGLKFCNMTVDWDWEKSRLASVVRVIAVDGDSIVLEFAEADATFAMSEFWKSMIFADPDVLAMSGVPGRDGVFDIDGKTVAKKLTAANVIELTLISGYAKEFAVGDTLILRHHENWGHVFDVRGGSNHVVLEDVAIRGAAGVGVMIEDAAHHVRMTRLTIAPESAYADTRRISTTVDAIHIKDTGGYFILEDSEIAFSGDDCLNIHDNVGVVVNYWDDTLVIRARNTPSFRVGDTVSFRCPDDHRAIPFTATVISRSVDGDEITLGLDRDCEDEIAEGMIVHDESRDSGNYIIRNCFFHDNRARGILAGSSNGLIENCRFARIQKQALSVPIDITSDMWTEGKGVSNLIIRNNVFEKCNVYGADSGSAISFVASSAAAKSGTILGECFTDVLISGNTFLDLPGRLMTVISARKVTVYGNEVRFPGENFAGFNAAQSGTLFVLGQYYDGSTIFGNTWITS
ncbi:MAG: right-handed parallel beta-helix repeat-containing protein, partial [Firmicutes bacterium]|nr:right-handed parallel beta-helix repeat-containing protein [Bacillota bacterium]